MGMPSITRRDAPRPKLRVTFRSSTPALAHDAQTRLDKVDGDDEESANLVELDDRFRCSAFDRVTADKELDLTRFTVVLADLGRPRNARIGTMDFNCFGVSGCTSASALAAAVMTLSFCAAGIATNARLDTFDIVSYLSTIGTAQAYDPSRLATIYKDHAVEDTGLRREC